MKTVHNERLKLTATFLNGIAIAIFVIGTFAPAVQTALTMTVPGGARSRTVVIGAICIFVAGALHFAARAVLGRLKE